MSYILLCYADKYRTILIGFRLFLKIKDCAEYTKNLISYSDLNKGIGQYHTYKSYLALIELSNYEEWRYFFWRDLVKNNAILSI